MTQEEIDEAVARYGISEEGLNIIFTIAKLHLKRRIEVIAIKQVAISHFLLYKEFPPFNHLKGDDESIDRAIADYHEGLTEAMEYLFMVGEPLV